MLQLRLKQFILCSFRKLIKYESLVDLTYKKYVIKYSQDILKIQIERTC